MSDYVKYLNDESLGMAGFTGKILISNINYFLGGKISILSKIITWSTNRYFPNFKICSTAFIR